MSTVSSAPQRFMDQIDADRVAIDWLTARAKALGADRIEWHTHQTDGRTGSAWYGNTLLAGTVVLRDLLNYSTVVCFEPPPVGKLSPPNVMEVIL